MIKLLIDNQYPVYLEPKTNLRIEFSMPFFDSEAIPSPVIYPFNIPIFKNESIFEYCHYDLIGTRTKVFNVTFYFDDLAVLTGKFYIKTINSDYYRGSIIFSGFPEGFSEFKLNDLSYSDITIGGTPHSSTNVAFHAEQVVKGILIRDYTFPVIFANNFYGEPDDDGIPEANPDWGGDTGSGPVGKYLNNYNAPSGTFPVNLIREDPLCDNTSALIPCPFLFPVIRKMFSEIGFSCFGDFLSDAELQKLILFYNFPLDEQYKKYFVRASYPSGVQTISQPGDPLYFNVESGGDLEDADSCWNIATHRYEVKSSGYHTFKVKVSCYCDINGGNVNARLSLKTNAGDVLDQDNFTLVSETWDTFDYELIYFFPFAMIGTLVYLHLRYTNQYGEGQIGSAKQQTLIATNVSYQNLNQYSNKLNIAKHLPPVSYSTFINSLKNAFGLGVFFDFVTRNVEFSFITDIINSPFVLDLSDKVLQGNKELELPDHKGYKLNISYNKDTYPFETYEFIGEFPTWDDLPVPNAPNKTAIDKSSNTVVIFKRNADEDVFSWHFYSDNIYKVVVGEGKEEIISDFNTLPLHLGNNLLTAQTKDLGTSPCFDTGDNEFPFTLLFYRGMQKDAKNDDYPMASSVNYSLSGALIGDYQTKMNGDNGLYNKFLKPWYDFLETSEEFKRSFLCSSVDFFNIASLFLPQKVNPVRKIRFESMNCIPKKATFVFSSSGIITTEMILLKSNSGSGGR
jgi:hypothetical protein